MDVLSEVLKVVKLEGALFFNAEFSAPWCLRSSGSSATPYLSPEGRHLILYHFLTEGRAYAKLADGRREELIAGDIIVFPRGELHLLGNGTPERPVDSFQTFAKNLSPGLKVVSYGGGGEVTRFVCGFMACDPRLGEVFLAGLPPMLKVHVVHDSPDQWLEHSIRFTTTQESESTAG